MDRWYSLLLKKIKNSGNRIFIVDSNNLLNDKNFLRDLSLEYKLHKFRNESDLNIFLNNNLNNKILVYFNQNIQSKFIKNNFDNLNLSLKAIFTDLDINILNNMDVSYLQKIYDYYIELKSQDKKLDTEYLIFKSIWDVDLGKLNNPTENLKIVLSYLIDKKDFDDSILEIISKKLSIDIKSINETSLMENIILEYVYSLNNDDIPKFDLTDNLIQFYIHKIDLNMEKISKNINSNTIEKEKWLSSFKEDFSNENIENIINNDIYIFKEKMELFNQDSLDLNLIDEIFNTSRLFFKIFHNIQYYEFSFDDFCDIEFCYLSLNNLFKRLLNENIYEQLFNYRYDIRPYTINRLLDHVNYNLNGKNLAFIVFDGMSYDEWFILKKYLTSFEITETESFAILPTITQFSRTSMFTRKLPKKFIKNEKTNYSKQEKDGFIEYFKEKEVEEKEILFGRIDLNKDFVNTTNEKISFEYLKGYKAIGLIYNLFDDLSHETVVYGDMKSNLYKNIENSIKSSNIIQLLEKLKNFGYKIVISSDHGNIYCKGNNVKYNKNLQFDKKSKRVLIFNEEIFADNLIKKYPEKLVKFTSNIFPKDLFFILATENYFFSKEHDNSITHGSFMPEEWIVPVVILE